jgi:glycosidase
MKIRLELERGSGSGFDASEDGMTESRIADIDFAALKAQGTFLESPTHWEDEVLYFLMLDRFSDGNETNVLDNDGFLVTQAGGTPLFGPGDEGNAVGTPAEALDWREAGSRFVGGTLRGLEARLGYLKRLGITAIWVSPVFKQVPTLETYHGYGIQNFLDVDPRFGSRDDLKALVRTAHGMRIRVILDVILNHSGDVFAYQAQGGRCDVLDSAGNVSTKEHCWQADGQPYAVAGFRAANGSPTLAFGPVGSAHFPDGAIWPLELQAAETFTRKGRIRNFDFDPEFREGDFFDLKDIHLGSGTVDEYRPSAALRSLCECLKFWIAFLDVDGFRVDTVKHMDDGASRFFTSVIHEFAEDLGKHNFYLIAEITGGRKNAVDTLERVGMNAALGIEDIPDKLEYMVKGFRDPNGYFDLFRNSIQVGKDSHTWFRDKVVTTLDDHDQVRKGGHKSRFANDEGPGQLDSKRGSLAVLALLTTSMGIPCIYYGSEQQFDGQGGNDRFIREAMFGGAFGAFRSKGRHVFNEGTFVFVELSKILRLRKDEIVIRRGRQYLRQISGNGVDFGFPRMLGGRLLSIVPWSRIFNQREVLLAINTNFDAPTTAWVTIDDALHPVGSVLTCAYSSDAGQLGEQVPVEARNGKAVQIRVPPAGFVVFR